MATANTEIADPRARTRQLAKRRAARRRRYNQVRADRIESLARKVVEEGPEVYDRALERVKKLADRSLADDKVKEAFDDLCDQSERLMDLQGGAITWREVEHELTCPDPDTAAEQILEQAVADARDLLVYGR